MSSLQGAETSDFQSASARLQGNLVEALDRLDQVRGEVSAARIPLARQRNELEGQVVEKRREAGRLERLADNQAGAMRDLETRVAARREENAYLQSLSSEYVRSFEARLHPAEYSLYASTLEPIGAANATGAEGGELGNTLLLSLEALEAGLDRLGRVMGGQKLPGEAITPVGQVVTGDHLLLGPFSYFAGSQAGLAGLTEVRTGSLRPTLLDLGGGLGGEVASFLNGSGSVLPLDITGGNAIKMAEQRETLVEHIQAGGVVMIPILLLAFAALVIALWKWFEIAGVKQASAGQVDTILKHLNEGRKPEAVKLSREIRGPVGQLLETAIKFNGERKEILEELLYEKVLSAQPKLSRFLPFIALTAATAPLLGLLGTVTGMINTFKLITIFGTGDARLLSGGISEALVTTEFGLIIAIPALLAHGLLSRKAKGVVGSMERTAVAFINGLSTTVSSSEEKLAKAEA